MVRKKKIANPTVQVIENPESVCGRERKNPSPGEELCIQTAGYRTEHVGEGACIDHEGQNGKVDLAIIGTDPSNGHDASYSMVITHPQLLKYFEAQMTNKGELDNIDNEIALMRSMIMWSVEQFGKRVLIDKEGEAFIVDVAPQELRKDIADFTGIIQKLTQAIKAKYEIHQIAAEMIPRGQVKAYMAQVVTILNNVLRDTCSQCKHEHGMRTKTIQTLQGLSAL
jgi:hypothetical protein